MSGDRQAHAARHPDLSTEEGRLAFIRILNDRLPTKRTIAQGVMRDEEGRVLLCRLTYKKEWDLPGGVVDPHESPAACLAREVREELGLDLPVGDLLAVNWLPPWRGWDDATLLLFDLGVAEPGLLERANLLEKEIRDVQWCTDAETEERAAAYTVRMLRSVTGATGTLYLEDGEPR